MVGSPLFYSLSMLVTALRHFANNIIWFVKLPFSELPVILRMPSTCIEVGRHFNYWV